MKGEKNHPPPPPGQRQFRADRLTDENKTLEGILTAAQKYVCGG